MVSGFQAAPIAPRHTPEPVRVRFAAGSLFLLGILVGLFGALLQFWSLQLALDAATAGNCFLVVSLGVLTSRLIASRLPGGAGRAIRGLLAASGVLAALSLIALGSVYQPLWLLPPLFGVGLSMGALTTAVAWLLHGAMTVHRAPEVLNLAGVSFGAGAVTICLMVWSAADRLPLSSLLWLLAGLPAVLAVAAWRAGSFRYLTLPASEMRLTWRDTLNPTAVLLALALFVQAANLWTVGGWLALYLTRKFGITTSTSLAALAVFWLALTLGRVAATRLPPLEEQLRWMALTSAACLTGCVFLLQTAETSGALVGAALLGAGIGAQHPMTVGAIRRRHPRYHPGLLNGFFSLSFVGSMFVPWLIGQVAVTLGIEMVIWTTLAGTMIVFVLLAILVVETRLTESTAAAR